MKFLLGIKVSENVSKGTIIYKKSRRRQLLRSMPLQKLEITLSQSPIKLIELTTAKKDVGT
jgi:hypothetical protein